MTSLAVLVTAFCSCVVCTGRWYGAPCSDGTRPRVLDTIACDPRVFPMGTVLWLEGVGVRTCHTTGRLVRGAHVDEYVESHKLALKLGRRLARATVLSVPRSWSMFLTRRLARDKVPLDRRTKR